MAGARRADGQHGRGSPAGLPLGGAPRRAGPERARLLARFAIVGGGDDEIASALAGHSLRVDDLLSGVPLLAAGAHADATAFGLSALDAEPYSEPAHRLLVHAQLAAGDRIGARRALDACVAKLAELNLEPEPATVALLDSSPLTSR